MPSISAVDAASLNVVPEMSTKSVEARPDIKAGSKISLEEIFDEGFDAIIVATGAKDVTPFQVEGGDLKGAYDAYEFLIKLDRMEYYKNRKQKIPFKVGKHVLVVGGGDTAVDAARTSLRLGAKQVTMMYRRSEREITAYRFGLESAKEEGVKVEFLQVPIRFIGNERGWVKKAECVKMRVGGAGPSR